MVYLHILNKLCNLFKKGYKEKEDIFLFNKTLIYTCLQRFFSNNKSLKFSGGFLQHQFTYTKPLNTHACLEKLEN
jgi:hypothetical protein